MAKFRISSLYVDLVYQLGTILRSFIGLEILDTESWTFTFDGVSAPYQGRNPMTYYGKGTFTAEIPEEYRKNGKAEDRVQVRAMCDLFPEGDYDEWLIYYWVKYPNGMVLSSSAQRRPSCQLDHGWARTANDPPWRIGSGPPPQLKFK